MQSQCLVVRYEDEDAEAAPWSGIATHDMAAGGRILHKISNLSAVHDCMCAVQAIHSLRSLRVHHSRSPARCAAQGALLSRRIHTARRGIRQRDGRRV